MKHFTVVKVAAVALLALSGTAASSAAKLRVVATTPDLASIAREIGGTAVEVTALGKPTEDQHSVDAKPSHIVTLNRADVLIEGGAELELGWLPPLLENARNAKIAAGAPGRSSLSRKPRPIANLIPSKLKKSPLTSNDCRAAMASAEPTRTTSSFMSAAPASDSARVSDLASTTEKPAARPLGSTR